MVGAPYFRDLTDLRPPVTANAVSTNPMAPVYTTPDPDSALVGVNLGNKPDWARYICKYPDNQDANSSHRHSNTGAPFPTTLI